MVKSKTKVYQGAFGATKYPIHRQLCSYWIIKLHFRTHTAKNNDKRGTGSFFKNAHFSMIETLPKIKKSILYDNFSKIQIWWVRSRVLSVLFRTFARPSQNIVGHVLSYVANIWEGLSRMPSGKSVHGDDWTPSILKGITGVKANLFAGFLSSLDYISIFGALIIIFKTLSSESGLGKTYLNR